MSNLSPRQFKFLHSDDRGGDGHLLSLPGKGRIEWDSSTGKVLDVRVLKEHQRQGHATHLWAEAHRLSSELGITPPAHSPARTSEGDAWAQSVGGNLPELSACTSCGDEGHLASDHP